MKRNLIILMALIMVMTVVAPSFAADDWEFSGWAQTENTIYGELSSGKSSKDEYALKARLTAFKKASDNLSYTFTFATRGLMDMNESKVKDLHEVWMRQGTVNYKFNDMISMDMGKKPVWLGPGGLFGDDYIRGVDFRIKPSSNFNMRAVYGHHDPQGGADEAWVRLDNKIGYLEGNYNVPNSSLSLGAHFLRGDKTAHIKSGDFSSEDNTSIWGLSSGYQLSDDLGLSLAYAQNTDDYSTKTVDLSDNSEIRLQAAYTGLEKTSLFFRYYNRGAGILYPHGNGNYLTGWADKYSANAVGFQGVRLIAVRPLTNNITLTGVVGFFQDTEDGIDETATKNTLTLTTTF